MCASSIYFEVYIYVVGEQQHVLTKKKMGQSQNRIEKRTSPLKKSLFFLDRDRITKNRK